MAAQIVSFLQRRAAPRDWAPHEIAEFYRVESALLQAGLSLETDRGVSDEGDPWFVFCRADNGEAFIHFARIDGEYVIDGAVFESPTRGQDFASLVRALIARHPLARNREAANSNVFLHPAALLIALVGTAFFHTSEAKAAEVAEHKGEVRRQLPHVFFASGSVSAPRESILLDANQTAAIMTGAMIGLRQAALLANMAKDVIAPGLGLSSDVTSGGKPPADLERPFAPTAVAQEAGGHKIASPDAEMRAVLAVVAVLHDLANASPTVSQHGVVEVARAPANMADVILAPASDISIADAPALPSTEIDRPVLIVTLTSDTLPDVEAIHIVQASGVLSQIDVRNVTQLERLPTILANAIDRGERIDGTLHAPPILTEVAPTVPSPDHSGSEAPSTPATSMHNPPVPSGPAPGPSAPLGHDPMVDAAVALFSSEVRHLDAILSGRDVVLYDHQILEALPSGTTFDSVTFTLGDGSTISLVGTTQEIVNLHLH